MRTLRSRLTVAVVVAVVVGAVAAGALAQGDTLIGKLGAVVTGPPSSPDLRVAAAGGPGQGGQLPPVADASGRTRW
jgi:hypothetical protein